MCFRTPSRPVALVCVFLLAITGCTPSGTSAGPSRKPAQATAPPIAGPQASELAAHPAVQPQPAAAEEQKVHELIAQVEAAYAAGDADYRKGMLPEAKIQFNHAVDLMLTSGLDIKAIPQLDDEFEKIIDQVNGLEMEALKQGNGFVSKEEATPAEAANEATFAVNPNLMAKAQADLATTKSDLPLVMNDYVAAFINFFAYTTKGHYTLLHAFQRSGRYKAMIQRILAEEGVPQDLIYLAVAESGFQPRAVDRRSGAGGMWQFMPHGNYGLVRNSYVDERFDPEKSTLAYARYMKFLHDQLGDWYLAMAAYDHGAGNIQHEVQRTGYADFWQLYNRHELPRETANYVPEILAAIIIANHPHQYGFDDLTLDPPVLTDTVTIGYSIDLRLVSDLVDAPVDEIESLNPSLLRMVTPPDTSFDLHLPAGTATLFEQRVALIPEARRNCWRYHTVVSGDTLASVAQAYHVSAAELASANQLEVGDSLAGVSALAVPVPLSTSTLARTRLYVARRGDTLITIADRFGVSLSQLRRWNGIRSGIHVAPGRRLRVAEPVLRHREISPRRPRRKSAAPKTAVPSSHRRTHASRTRTKQGRSSRHKPTKRSGKTSE